MRLIFSSFFFTFSEKNILVGHIFSLCPINGKRQIFNNFFFKNSVSILNKNFKSIISDFQKSLLGHNEYSFKFENTSIKGFFGFVDSNVQTKLKKDKKSSFVFSSPSTSTSANTSNIPNIFKTKTCRVCYCNVDTYGYCSYCQNCNYY